MKVGAVYPQIELQGDPAAVDKFGRTVEALGFDHLMMYDHVIGAVHEDRDPPLWERGPYTDKDPFHDPLVTFGYLAGITKKIELVTGVIILPQRQTALVAKQAADIDLLSNGRLRLGVGVGWNYVEYEVLGQDFYNRGKRFTEQIDVLRKLWSEPLVTFNGEFHKIDRANILPRPKRKIPVYCGGFAEPAFRRAAKMADGFIFAAGLEEVFPAWKLTKEFLKREGRPIDGFGADLIVQDHEGRGFKPEEVAGILRRWQDAGGTHASVCSMGQGFAGVDQHLDYFAEVRRQVPA